MTVCENCKQNLKEMRLSFYKDGIEAMKEGWIGLLPERFDSIVEEYFHMLLLFITRVKLRCDCNYCLSGDEDSSYSDDENDSDIDIPYDGLVIFIKIMQHCCVLDHFLEGIQRIWDSRRITLYEISC